MRFAGGLLPPGVVLVLRGSPVVSAPLPAGVQLRPGSVSAPLPVLSAPAGPSLFHGVRVGASGPGEGLVQAILLVELVVSGWERRAVPAQRVGA